MLHNESIYTLSSQNLLYGNLWDVSVGSNKADDAWGVKRDARRAKATRSGAVGHGPPSWGSHSETYLRRASWQNSQLLKKSNLPFPTQCDNCPITFVVRFLLYLGRKGNCRHDTITYW